VQIIYIYNKSYDAFGHSLKSPMSTIESRIKAGMILFGLSCFDSKNHFE
jgi:hypothetical protein